MTASFCADFVDADCKSCNGSDADVASSRLRLTLQRR